MARHNFEHYVDVVKTLCEWRRVLKPGGVMAILVPDEQAGDTVYLDPTHKLLFALPDFLYDDRVLPRNQAVPCVVRAHQHGEATTGGDMSVMVSKTLASGKPGWSDPGWNGVPGWRARRLSATGIFDLTREHSAVAAAYGPGPGEDAGGAGLDQGASGAREGSAGTSSGLWPSRR